MTHFGLQAVIIRQLGNLFIAVEFMSL